MKDQSLWGAVVGYGQETLDTLYVLWVASWGGVVAYFHNVRSGKVRWNWYDFAVYGLIIPGFVGWLTAKACTVAGMKMPNDDLGIMLIAIGGHLGTKALVKFKEFYMAFTKVLTHDQQEGV